MNERQHDPGEQHADSAFSAPAGVELHIEELLLHGFNPNDRHAISDAVEHELTRLLVNGGISGIGAGTMVERLDGGRFKVAPGMKAGAVGKQLAQTLYRGMAPVAGKGPARGDAKPGSSRTK
ncbi:MAG TPA: hypothetical protein VF532_18275 [Candidatus Angelobacter sp.]